MKHAILILAHKEPEQICNLIATFKGRYSVFVHIDKKSCFTVEELKKISQQAGVTGLYCKYNINWSGFNMLKCEMFLLKESLQHCNADYFHLISGQDYPIKPLVEFETRFEQNRGKEFISYMGLPSPNWESNTYYRFQYFLFNDLFDARISKGSKWIDRIVAWQKHLGFKRRIPDQFDHLYGGSQWFSITRECASYLLEYTRKHPAFYQRLKYTFAPEETYVVTVIMNSPFSQHVVNDNYRFIRWKYENGNFPANLSEIHFYYLATSGALFARKLEYPLSKKLIQLIDCYLLRESEVRVTKTGSWEHDTLDGHSFDPTLATALIRLCHLMKVETAVDFGCGPGWYVAALRRGGISIMGYDGNPHVEKFSSFLLNNLYPCKTVDMTDELVSDKPYDLILCLNVGEYISVKYENQLIQNIVNNAKKYIILSWAAYRQEGSMCINPHSSAYIIRKFSKYGFAEIGPATRYLREQATLSQFKNTTLVFQKEIYLSHHTTNDLN